MKAKTIFLSENNVYVFESMWHNDNYDNYIKKYFSNLEITEHIPLLLIKNNQCVIDLSRPYDLGVIYLPDKINEFQKDYFYNQKDILKRLFL